MKKSIFYFIAFMAMASCSVDECFECKEPTTVTVTDTVRINTVERDTITISNNVPCPKIEVETQILMAFQGNPVEGVSISTNKGIFTTVPETSEFGEGYPKFGTDPTNVVATIADTNGYFLSGGGTMTFDFDGNVEMESINFLDSDFSGNNHIKVYIEGGTVETVSVPKVGTEHSNQLISLPYDNVVKVEITSYESFAIDLVKFKKVETIDNCKQ